MTIAPEMTEPEMTKPQTDGPIPTEQQEELELQGFKQRKAYWEEEQRDDDNKDDLCHWSASKDATIDSLPENIKSIARNLRIAVEQMHLGLTKGKELILETARQLDEEHVEEQAKICKKIKEILKDKIQEGKISEGWIEESLPREYKRKYTKTESQQNHLSGVQQPELVISTQGNQISQSDKPSDIDSKSPDTEAISSLFERQEDKSPSAGEASLLPAAADVNLLSHPSDKYIGQECPSCLELQDQVTQLREVLKRISIPTADQIPASEFELIIPNEEYEMVKDATDKSKSTIFVKCDGSKKFTLALADVDN